MMQEGEQVMCLRAKCKDRDKRYVVQKPVIFVTMNPVEAPHA